MTDDKPIILYVELEGVLRGTIGGRLQEDMPDHTVISVENYGQASVVLTRCLGQGIVPLVVTEGRPVQADDPATPTCNRYGSALGFINEALGKGATVIAFTNAATRIESTRPCQLVTVEKPYYDKLLAEIRRQTSNETVLTPAFPVEYRHG